MTALLQLDDVEARYGPVQALHDVSLEVAEGEVVVRARRERRGQDDDAAGDLGHGEPQRDDRPRRQAAQGRARGRRRAGIAHVPEGRGTFVELTLTENLRLGAYTRRDRQVKDGHRARLRVFPWMHERGGQRAGTLSGGEQQMLALARALMSRPNLLLLDEPCLGLAPMVVREFFRTVRHLNENEGLTVLVVEQDARIALASSVARLRARGRPRRADRARARSSQGDELSAGATWVLAMLVATFADFMQQVVSGIASGGIYACSPSRS